MKRNSLSYWIILLTIATLLASCSPVKLTDDGSPGFETKFAANVIYGSDGRLDLYQLTDDRLKQLADSTVALMKTNSLKVSGSTVSISGENYGTSMNLCSSEKFREQNTAAFCSGTLIGPDTVLTAGHCIESMSDCQSTSLVFGFAVKVAGVLPQSVSANEVYRCSQIIKTLRVNNGADFALIKLDRAVTNHRPLAVRASGEVEASASLVVIGHPVGLPTKVTTGGSVRSLSNPDYFVANLDTYGGNSGSAVINLASGLIEGVLVRGEQDFENHNGCTVSKVCAEGACRGEDVTRISAVRSFIPADLNPPPVEPPPIAPPPVVDVPPTKFTSNVRVAIPDNNKTGITSSLLVSETPKGRKVVIGLQVKHPYIGDLSIKVLAADGKSAILHQRAGGSSDDIDKSYEVTSSLGQVSAAGSYKLVVQDLAARDVGNLISWSVEFN
jgi:hypothetical protein